MNSVGVLPEFFRVCKDQRLSRLHKVAMLFVVDFNGAPRVCTSASLTVAWCIYKAVRSNDCKDNGPSVTIYGEQKSHTYRSFLLLSKNLLVHS